MKQDLIIRKNDPRSCIKGTEDLWSVCSTQKDGDFTITVIIAENVEHADAVLFAAAPDLLKALIEMCGALEDANSGAFQTLADARAAITKATTQLSDEDAWEKDHDEAKAAYDLRQESLTDEERGI